MYFGFVLSLPVAAWTTGMSLNIVPAGGTASTTTIPTARHRPAGSGSRTTTCAQHGRNARIWEPRYIVPCLKRIWVMGLSLIPQLNTVMSILWLIFLLLQEAIQSSERSRLAEQIKFTPVWELRKVPPKDWHMPLNYDRPQDSWTLELVDKMHACVHCVHFLAIVFITVGFHFTW